MQRHDEEDDGAPGTVGLEEATSGAFIVRATVRIVEAYVASNHVAACELPAMIASVADTVSSLVVGSPSSKATSTPAVMVKDSVTADFIICLEDGKKFRSLKKHLGMLGFTPEEYRAKWKLPADYPMVAPNYSTMRSRIAKGVGLGRWREKGPPVT